MLVTARFEQSMSTPEAFFTAESEKIAEACWAMALRRTTLEQSGKQMLDMLVGDPLPRIC